MDELSGVVPRVDDVKPMKLSESSFTLDGEEP